MSLKTRLISPYQHEGVKWMTSRETAQDYPGGFLCDEMGLGKTVQIIATMIVNPRPRTLIVVPKSIVGQWVSEIHKFAPHLTVDTFNGTDRKVPDKLPDIMVAPYSVLPRGDPCPLVRIKWDRVILDEGHEIRNPKSKTFILCKALMADIRWVLTGTPVFNSMRDFVTLCAFLGIPREYVQGYTDDVRRRYVIRRTKVDLAQHNKRLELPKCDFDNIELEMYPEERQLYASVFGFGQDVVRSISKMTNVNHRQMELLEALLRVRQVLCWPQLYLDGMARKEEAEPELWEGRSKKMDTLIDLIKSHPDEKTLVFCSFTGEMDEIQSRLMEIEVPVFRIDGSVTGDARDERVAKFKAGPSRSVFIIQIKAGGVGLNLQQATRVYITSPSWNPATELQAIGRAHRTGQTQVVTVRRLVYAGYENLPSVEMSIMQLQDAKAKICAEILNDPRLETVVPNIPKTKINILALRKIFAV
jgi:SNF2 family DNA or RNA helicase